MEGKIMDSDRFDGLVRSFGQSRSRRQTLRGLAGAGALLAQLAATPVAAGTGPKPNAPHKPPKNPGKGQPGNSQPGSGQNGGGQLGSPGPSEDYPGACGDQCDDAIVACEFQCPDPACFPSCDRAYEACIAACPPR
jgi:hypothetical protein